MTFSRTTILGNLGKDPECRYTPNNVAVADISVAFDYKIKDQKVTNWTRVTLWGKQAEWAREWQKGDQVLFTGLEYRISEYEKDGEVKKSHVFESTFGTQAVNLSRKKDPDDQRTPASEMAGEENQDDMPF